MLDALRPDCAALDSSDVRCTTVFPRAEEPAAFGLKRFG